MSSKELGELVAEIKACRICVEQPVGKPLPHEPRPVVVPSVSARILIAGQAPGTKVHLSGAPFTDASGDRLRDWLGVSSDEFYDPDKFAIVPMGFCFPGNDAQGGDLPPRRECRARWHESLFGLMPQIEIILAIGRAAQDYHFARLGRPLPKGASLAEIVRASAEASDCKPRLLALPHPSWRNNAWLKRNPWFEDEIVPLARGLVAEALPPRGAPPPP